MAVALQRMDDDGADRMIVIHDEEFTDLLVRLRTEDHVDATGRWFSARGARTLPRLRDVPLLVAANGPRSLAYAARTGDGWVTTGPRVDLLEDWWAGLQQVTVPLLCVAGAGDHQDPEGACRELFEQFGSDDKAFLVLGREHGFSEDFGHVPMLVSKAAQTQVWPRVADWLNRHVAAVKTESTLNMIATP